MAQQRLLVIDADIDNRVATELKARGRAAVAASELSLHRERDGPLLRGLAERFGDTASWVLVTGDDAMPDDHNEVLVELGVTVATIDPRRPAGTRESEWRRDVVHRWAHAMGIQAAGSIRRYSTLRHGAWKPRRTGRRR